MGIMSSRQAAQEAKPNTETVDVAIIGGGPTGLFTGLLLQRLGVSVCILDAKDASLELGRADALNARTQQYFEVANLLNELLAQGLKCNTSSTFAEGEFKSRQSHWWTGLEHCQHKNFLMIGQPVIEGIMSDLLKDFIHYGEKVTTISEDNDFVNLTTDKGRQVRSKYALAADGARSTIRSALGISFKGTKPEMLWAVIDTFIDTDFPVCPEIITFELGGQSRVAWIPRERDLNRFYVLLEGDVNLERAQESIKQHMAPHRVDFTKTEWYSTFDVKERIASTFISKDGEGRILLGGDAAHVHSVNGGQGLNTGISDAFAVAWRLAMILKQNNLKPETERALIRSYDTERRATAQGVIDVAAALVRDTLHTAKQYVGTIERAAGNITGMGVSYAGLSSPFVHESEVGIWQAGYRCPDVQLKLSSGEQKWLYTIAAYGKFIVFCIGGHIDLGERYQNLVTVYDILPGDAKVKSKTGSEAFAADWVAKEEERFYVVVRPDMYVGFAGKDGEGAREYLSLLL